MWLRSGVYLNIGVYLNSGVMEKTKICVIPEIQSTFKLHVCPRYINTFLESASKTLPDFYVKVRQKRGLF